MLNTELVSEVLNADPTTQINGTAVEIEQRKQALAQSDEFSSIRSLWAGCAACHGQDGGGGRVRSWRGVRRTRGLASRTQPA